MALINYATREINAKIVYYGPGLSGKTTNIHYVFSKVRPDNKGKLISLATQGDRTLFFDFLPVELGSIKGFRTRFHLYTVPGQVYYNSTRKMVLKGSDGVVFVADSQNMMLEENIQSLDNLKSNLRDMGLDIEKYPVVFQYNKRDLPNAVPLKELDMFLNPGGRPYFEASAVTGEGVLKTLTGIVKYILHDLKEAPDTHSLDFDAIGDAAESVVSGQVPAYTGERPAALEAAPAPDAAPVQEESAPPVAAVSWVEPEGGGPGEEVNEGQSEYSFESPPIEDEMLAEEDLPGEPVQDLDTVEVTAHAELEDEGGLEMPEASPDMFSSSSGLWYDENAVPKLKPEVIEGLGKFISDTSPTLVDEDAVDAELEPLPEDMSYDTFPATSADTLDEVLNGYPSEGPAEAGTSEAVPEEEMPAEVIPEVQPGIAAAPVVEAKKEYRTEKAGAESQAGAEVEDKAPAAEPAALHLRKRFRLPVRFTTSEGVKEVSLSLSMELEISGEELDILKAVDVLEPRQDNVRPANPAVHQGDKSKHPPPIPTVSIRKSEPAEPAVKLRKKGMFEKMFGR